MVLYKNINELLTLENAYNKDGRNLIPSDMDIIEDAALVFNDEEIIWKGETKNIPSKLFIL